MPTFNLVTKPVNMPNAVEGHADNTALNIQQQSRNQLSQQVDNFAGAYKGMIIEQDEADMVASRSAILRLQADEDNELSNLSNPADIAKVQERYKKSYDDVIGGKEPLNGKPYFRNQSGKDAFNQGFMNEFNTRRAISGKKLENDLQRRDTHAKYMNGIKSIIDQPNWNTPNAHEETGAYVNKLIEGGYYTAEEGAEFRKVAHTNLDIERSNKMFANMESVPFEGEGKGYEKLVNDYKEDVNNLKHLDQEEKNAYIKKADQLFKQKKTGAKLAKTEAENTQKKTTAKYDATVSYQVATGAISASKAHKDPNLSMKTREALAKQAKQEKSVMDDVFQSTLSLFKQNDIEALVYNYAEADDADGSKMERLQLSIAELDAPSALKSNYLDILVNGRGLSKADEMELDQMDQQLKFTLGMDLKIDSKGTLITQGQKGFKNANGMIMKEQLNQFDRLKIYNKVYGTMYNTMKRGKAPDARKAFREVIQEIEKEENDKIFYDAYIGEDFITTGAK